MNKKEETIVYNGITYKVVVSKRVGQKRIYFRFRNGIFYVSCPFLCTKVYAIEQLYQFVPKLLNAKPPKIDLKNNTIYILGEKVVSSNLIFNVLGFSLLITNEEEFYKKIKPIFWKYLNNRVQIYKELMGIPVNYKVRVQKMTSRLGSNSKKTQSLNFNLKLIHYSKEAIDSVIVHELAHYFQFNHSNHFYDVVYKYCPNYDKLNKEFKN